MLQAMLLMFLTVPYFIEVDDLVYSRIGNLVTLTCLPNDTMATVYWLR